MIKNIFIIAGEKSGDLLGSKILKQLDKNKFNIYGIGGELMEREGLKSFFPMKELSVMGIFEILPRLFIILKRINETAKRIIELMPDIVLTIDSPDFCFRVMKMVKKLDIDNRIKKVHFVAPSVWVHRKNRAEKIAKIYDLLFCILPFEPPYFEKYGLKTIFVGHPIFDKESLDYDFNSEKINYNRNSNEIAITVGSRKSEIEVLLPIVLDAINRLKVKYSFKYNILATDDTYDIIKNKLKKLKVDYINVEKDFEKKSKILKNSLFAIAKCGTNILEISAFKLPMVIIYKFGFLTNLIARYLQKRNNIKYVDLVNIISNKEIYRELLLNNCNSDNIFIECENLINNENLRLKQIELSVNYLKILGYKNNNSCAKRIASKLMEI